MKKYIIASSILLVMFLLSGIVYGQTVETTVSPVGTSGVKIIYVFKQSIKMVFEGESKNWTGSYTTTETTFENGEKEQKVKIVVTPKVSKIAEWINYKIITSKGTIEGDEWLIFDESLELDLDGPIPAADEVIEVRIKKGPLTEIFNLNCKLYQNITPDESSTSDVVNANTAIKILQKQFYNIYGIEMPDTYTVFVEYIDGEWVVAYDDNDGIGGKAYLTIDAKSAETGDIKIEETDIKIQE